MSGVQESTNSVAIEAVPPVQATMVLNRPEPTVTPEPTPEPTPVTKLVSLGTFKIYGYCPCKWCCGKTDGITATGTKATAYRTLAVDPKVIPYGTTVIINGAKYVAEDCGGGIHNKTIDMFFNTHQEALNWGVQHIEVFMEVTVDGSTANAGSTLQTVSK